MHLVEQLRIKRTEAHNHLLSRKRKLAELFAATACTGEVPTPPTTAHYLRQLQAFQDANDLQNGRLFDESTLPSRPLIIYQPRHVSTQTTRNHDTRPLNISKTQPDVLSDGATVSNAADESDTKISQKPSPPSNLTNGSTGADKEHNPRAEVRNAAAENETEGNDALPPSKKGTEQASVRIPSISSPGKVNELALPNSTPLRSQTSPQISVPSATEPHSSPASTADAGSSNTPAPTTGSPTTSLGDDVTTGSAILDADKLNSQHDAPTLPQTPETAIVPRVHKLSVSSVDVENMDIDPATAFGSPQLTSAQPAISQREQVARVKPPIRINTQQEPSSAVRPQLVSDTANIETPALSTITDVSFKVPAITPMSAVDPNKRATRISSGALQKKSVSEILSGTPRSSSPQVDSPMSSSARETFFSTSLLGRHADRERKEKERSKLSTVVFAKPQRPIQEGDASDTVGKGGLDLEQANPEDRDYLYTLFESKAYASKSGNLSHLIQHAHKTITTGDYLVDYEYQAQCRVLKRLYQLQSADRWALRQRKRADEPARQTSHWDFLLDHAKWMRTDFREERKWKHAAARALAEACAEYVASSDEERKQLQVQVRPPRNSIEHQQDSDVNMEDIATASHPTPELLPSGEDESVSDDIADPRDINLAAAPAAIFSLGASDFNFMADRTPAFDKLINELPLYQPQKIEPDLAKSNLAERLDARWMTDIVPVSRFATEQLKIKEAKSPFKRSRYQYELEASPSRKGSPLPPRESNVGLFMPENKHIRDRIHPGHSFRPPSEHPMPTQAFFETRTSSHWTPTEDDELRKLVKDYSYNWSLISSCLAPKSLYSSSADRRTPWECFERWIGLEGMPTDMAKTPYFRTYSGRIEAASRHVQAQYEEAQRRAGTNTSVTARKRTNQPVRVDKKRAQRHLAMLDSMRKLAKKRETMRQKQQASAEMAAMRKTSEVNNQQRPPLKKPSEWSAHKFEEDQKHAKRQEIYRQQLIAHQRAATAQQRGPNGATNGVPNGVPQPNNQARLPNGTPVPMANGHLAVPNGASRPHSGMLGLPNGIPMSAGMVGPKGVQAQMQANMRNAMSGSPQQLRMQEQLMRQAQQNNNHAAANVAMANGVNADFALNGTSGTNGQPSPNNVGGTAGSPRQPGVGQALSSGHVPVLAQIAANIKRSHPDMSDEAIQRAASQQLTNWQQQATAAAAGHTVPRPRVNQAALNAALGAANAAAHAGNLAAAAAAANGGFGQGPNMVTHEQLQQYRQGLRMQQVQQQQHRNMQVPMSPAMMNQMANQTNMSMSRPVSQHNNNAGLSRSVTPRDPNGGNISAVNAAPSPSTNGGNTTPGAGGQPQVSPPRPSSQQTMQT